MHILCEIKKYINKRIPKSDTVCKKVNMKFDLIIKTLGIYVLTILLKAYYADKYIFEVNFFIFDF